MILPTADERPKWLSDRLRWGRKTADRLLRARRARAAESGTKAAIDAAYLRRCSGQPISRGSVGG